MPLHSPGSLESELAKRTLISEQRRSTLLAIVLAGIALIFTAHVLTVGQDHDALPAYQWVAVVVSVTALYEWGISLMLARMIKEGRQPARYRLYLNAVAEVAMPTLAAWIAAHYIPAAHAITGMATYPYFLLLLISTLRLDFALCVFTGVLTSAGFTFLAVVHWKELEDSWGGPLSGIHFGFFMRGIAYLGYGVVAGIVSKTIRRTLVETMTAMKERERVTQIFGQHLSPAVVNQLLTQSPGEVPELRDVCIMVLDIRNFTTYSEDRPADEVVAYLNTLWGFMVRTVNKHDGIVNKFLGDGFLAVFGAPISSGIDCKNAVAASRHILKELDEMTSSGRLPKTSVGIALHAGNAIVGDIGPEERKEYTVIGDVVNVAFRMEALNKDLGTQLLISEPVRESASVEATEKMAPIAVRGRHEPVQLYKIA